MKNFKYIWLLILFGLAGSVRAESVFISNNISTSANSGGQEETGQTSGSAQSSVFVQTKVNGQVVEEIDQSATGEKAQIKVQSAVKTEGDKAVVDTKVNNQGEVTSTTKIVPLEPKTETGMKKSKKEIEDGEKGDQAEIKNGSPEQKEGAGQRLKIFNLLQVVSLYIDNLIQQLKSFIYSLF